ncbi:hypothetical protein DC28_12990 [Spirochaeta lutea]|uniref:Uncharacterized protein n=1 Tax=Spirochaeta lutea TaxID=1480694 RepID=A0A098QUJ6_9SPIO|nr:hypothetical protein DC28_12990 [Spirochaeta lutea]
MKNQSMAGMQGAGVWYGVRLQPLEYRIAHSNGYKPDSPEIPHGSSIKKADHYDRLSVIS